MSKSLSSSGGFRLVGRRHLPAYTTPFLLPASGANVMEMERMSTWYQPGMPCWYCSDVGHWGNLTISRTVEAPDYTPERPPTEPD